MEALRARTNTQAQMSGAQQCWICCCAMYTLLMDQYICESYGSLNNADDLAAAEWGRMHVIAPGQSCAKVPATLHVRAGEADSHLNKGWPHRRHFHVTKRDLRARRRGGHGIGAVAVSTWRGTP
eukprot:352312-Chlamydomonas_euryale.AAC.14